MCDSAEEARRKCPVCRKSFLAKDIEHVLDFVNTQHAVTSSGSEVNNEDKLLFSHTEKLRREKFDAILKLQQENGGLIEIKKHEVLRPGIFSSTTCCSTLNSIHRRCKRATRQRSGSQLQNKF